jgi:hypothetical protein
METLAVKILDSVVDNTATFLRVNNVDANHETLQDRRTTDISNNEGGSGGDAMYYCCLLCVCNFTSSRETSPDGVTSDGNRPTLTVTKLLPIS